ncbi:MAG: hypothetical protein V9E88_14230 [Ferruginibacter sp.]
MIRQEPEKYKNFSIYPCMPYAHKYANAVTELGILGTIKQYVPGNFFGSIFQRRHGRCIERLYFDHGTDDRC